MKFFYSKKRVGDLSLNVVETEGEEPTLVMLHGVTRRWQTFLPVVHAFALRHKLMLVDFRGHGESDRAHEYAVTDYVDDICKLIHDHVPGPVALYGHSLGAMTVAGVAARLGHDISAIVMEDPPLQTMGTRINSTPLLSYFTGVSGFAGSTLDVGELARQLGDVKFHDPASGTELRVGSTRDDAQLRFAASCLKRLDPAVISPILQSQWLLGYNIDEVFSNLKCPSLLLQADYTTGGMLTEEDAQHVCDVNAEITRVRFPAVAHGIHWTASQQLLNTVLPFLESTR
ncbi:MAG TPA: alpha/beta hydrolase [Fuerstia sp.]|nr:alpha/beta hydrolase [Fuerstiella sp.]